MPSKPGSRRSSRISQRNPQAELEAKRNAKATIEDDLIKNAAYGNLASVKTLVTQKDINEKDFCGRTALVWATRNGHIPVMKFLFDEKAQQTVAPGGLHLTHHAAHYYNENVIEELVANGSSATCVDDAGNTPLHWAARRGILNPIQSLLNAGADLQALNDHGCTALHLAANNGHFTTVSFLLKQGINPDIGDLDGNTAVHYAAAVGFQNVLEVLYENGANMSLPNKDNKTPCDVACIPAIKEYIRSVGGTENEKPTEEDEEPDIEIFTGENKTEEGGEGKSDENKEGEEGAGEGGETAAENSEEKKGDE